VRVCFHARTCGIKVFVTEEQIAVGSGMDEFGCFNRAQARTRRVLFVQGWTFVFHRAYARDKSFRPCTVRSGCSESRSTTICTFGSLVRTYAEIYLVKERPDQNMEYQTNEPGYFEHQKLNSRLVGPW